MIPACLWDPALPVCPFPGVPPAPGQYLAHPQPLGWGACGVPRGLHVLAAFP